MQKYSDTVLMAGGQPAANVQVLVQSYPALGTVTIYSDNGVTPVANPLTTDALGNFGFYAADGRYQLTISGPGIQTTVRSDVLLVDPLPADLPTTLPSSSGKLWNNGGVISSS